MSRSDPGRAIRDGVAAGRELVVLGDGPWAPRWYWRDELEAMQEASRRIGHPDGHPAAELRGYRPADEPEQRPHPDTSDLTGTVWRFHPTAARAVPTVEIPRQRTGADVPADAEAGRRGTERGTGCRTVRRVLVTGSRDWEDKPAIRDGLARVWGDGSRVLVTGGCPMGADRWAEQCWRAWGGRVERHPADWARHGRVAGFVRNAAMVDRGADVCVAFIRDSSPGSVHTAGLAEAAGIPVHRITTHAGQPAAAVAGQAGHGEPSGAGAEGPGAAHRADPSADPSADASCRVRAAGVVRRPGPVPGGAAVRGRSRPRVSGAPVRVELPDGLYAVVQRPRFVAGFVVTGGEVRRRDCAPILWRRLPYWAGTAQAIEHHQRDDQPSTSQAADDSQDDLGDDLRDDGARS